MSFGFVRQLRHDLRPLVQDVYKVVLPHHQQIGGRGSRGRFAGKNNNKNAPRTQNPRSLASQDTSDGITLTNDTWYRFISTLSRANIPTLMEKFSRRGTGHSKSDQYVISCANVPRTLMEKRLSSWYRGFSERLLIVMRDVKVCSAHSAPSFLLMTCDVRMQRHR